jgi:type VI secretion system Hcp family effector
VRINDSRRDVRQHAPLTIIKPLDRSSPQFFAAAVTNETLSSVTCMLYRDVERGAAPTAYFKFVLSNAIIVDVNDAGDGANGGDERGGDHERGSERERISFACRRNRSDGPRFGHDRDRRLVVAYLTRRTPA